MASFIPLAVTTRVGRSNTPPLSDPLCFQEDVCRMGQRRGVASPWRILQLISGPNGPSGGADLSSGTLVAVVIEFDRFEDRWGRIGVPRVLDPLWDERNAVPDQEDSRQRGHRSAVSVRAVRDGQEGSCRLRTVSQSGQRNFAKVFLAGWLCWWWVWNFSRPCDWPRWIKLAARCQVPWKRGVSQRHLALDAGEQVESIV